jgi:hypothetical protein
MLAKEPTKHRPPGLHGMEKSFMVAPSLVRPAGDTPHGNPSRYGHYRPDDVAHLPDRCPC